MVAKPRVLSANLVNMPSVDEGTYAFTFTTAVGGASFTFVFKWLNGVWNGWAALPSGEVRQFGCVPNVVGWTGFADYGVAIISTLTAIGLNDLANVSLYLFVWEQ
jgi:hypothetical protein